MTGVTKECVERVARAICKSGKFETGEGTCSLLCMQFPGDPRKTGCGCAVSVHGDLARAALEASPCVEMREALERVHDKCSEVRCGDLGYDEACEEIEQIVHAALTKGGG
jgi:hypothetical protein